MTLIPPSFIEEKQKNPNAVALGRLGGLKGGPERACRLSPQRSRAIARLAAETRWQALPEGLDLLIEYLTRTPWRKKYEVAQAIGTTPEEISRWVHKKNRISNAYIKIIKLRLSEPVPERLSKLPAPEVHVKCIPSKQEPRVLTPPQSTNFKQHESKRQQIALNPKTQEVRERERRMDERSEKIRLMIEAGWL